MKIGFIGTGNMNSAIINGLVASGFDPRKIVITNRTMAKTDQFKHLNVEIVGSSELVIDSCELIVLGMKPDGYEPWLEQHDISGKKIISIGAGITSEFMERYTSDFVITMPNTPSHLRLGSTLIAESPAVTAEVIDIFQAIGNVHIIPEQDFDVYTLITGCSPAYFFSFVANMSDVLKTQYNLDSQLVNQMLVEVLTGSAAMLSKNPDPHQLCDNVCSPGGITIEVVDQLNKDLPDTFKRGFEAAIERTNQLKTDK
ncbi:pyrroline-5-carboxylate reductase [Mollicutes bacterium LVI A0039]|nr:pyrroline-5-carboxylate reductase [Mollicutes bacterium LVI A0039]